MAGKTTPARQLLTDYHYVNLELPENREFDETDPKTFMSGLGEKVILDEQERNGHFVLTGSNQFELSASIGQSLVGRTALLKLLPLSMEELGSSSMLEDQFAEIATAGLLPRVGSDE